MNATITNPVNLVLIVIGTFLALSLGIFLLLNKSVKNKANIFLGSILLILSFYFLTGFLFRFDLLEQFPHIIGLQYLGGFTIGPLAYLYVRSCTQKGFKMRPILWLHFIPFLIDIFINLPVLTQSGSEKVEVYYNFVKGGVLQQSFLILTIKTIHATIYFFLASHVILQYKKHLTNTASSIDVTFHRWVLFFIIILAFPVVGLIGFVFADFQKLFFMLVLLSFLGFFFAVYIATLVKPELFHAFPHQMALPESSEEQKQKYESSKLQEGQKDKYVEKLQTYVVMEKPYQEPELTLAQLSEKTKIPPHYLSQVINEKLNCSFLDFINGYRVKEAQEKLVDPAYSHYTILSLAYEAGFNSKSTFYSVFKKQTGMTPSQYRKQTKVGTAA